MNHFVLLGILSTCILWTVSKGFEPPYIDCSSRTVYVINETVPDTLKKGDIVLSVKGLKDFQKDNCEVFDFIERKGDNMTLKKDMSSFCVQNAASCGSVSCSSVGNVNIKFPVRWTISRELEYNISTDPLEYEAHVRELTAEDTHVPLDRSIQIEFKDCHGKGFGNPRLQLEQNTSTVPFSWGAVTNFDSLKVAGLIDYEVQTEYLLTLKIVYQEFHATATTTIKVIVEDVDDNKPRFNLTDVDAHYVLNIPENNQSLVNVPLPVEPPIYAYDPDFGINMTIWYSIIGQDKDGLFVIDPDSGDLNVTRALDRSEVDDFYKIFIEAAQTDNPNRAAHALVKVNVLEIDDHLPTVPNITEQIPTGTEDTQLHVFEPVVVYAVVPTITVLLVVAIVGVLLWRRWKHSRDNHKEQPDYINPVNLDENTSPKGNMGTQYEDRSAGNADNNEYSTLDFPREQAINQHAYSGLDQERNLTNVTDAGSISENKHKSNRHVYTNDYMELETRRGQATKGHLYSGLKPRRALDNTGYVNTHKIH